MAWSFLTPLLMLAVYTFVFSVVFNARWAGTGSSSRAEYAIFMFVGLIVHGIFAECVNRAPGLILGNANYVKKVVFPVEILPIVSMGGALFHSMASIVVLLIGQLVFGLYPTWYIIFLPLVLLPLVMFTLGISWFLSSIGVFVRDIGQIITLATSVMLFLSPVFYPLSAVSGHQRALLYANPLTYVIEQARGVLLLGQAPDWWVLLIEIVLGGLVATAGWWWFAKTRKGFADVI